MMKYTYNKLVRDKIPEVINKMPGREATYRVLNENEYKQELDKKLFEEAHEFIEEHSVEELGDLMEVILAIMDANNISMQEMEEARIKKRNKKGAFKDKIYLIEVNQDYEDEEESRELNKEWRKAKKQ